MARPTNIVLDESSRAVARRRAAERGLSMSGYIRELIRADEAAAGADSGDVSALIGLLGSGDEPTDIARHKHVMVAQAFGEDFENRQRRRAGPA